MTRLSCSMTGHLTARANPLLSKAIRWAATLGLFLYAATSAAPESSVGQPSPRYKALAKVIDRNVGHAHMTRGVQPNPWL